MTFADIYLYFVLSAPYAALPFIAIYFGLRWRSGWSMELPGSKVAEGLALSALLATLVVSGINLAIALVYPDPVLFRQHEILPIGGLTTLVYSVTGVAVSVLVWLPLKTDIKAFTRAARARLIFVGMVLLADGVGILVLWENPELVKVVVGFSIFIGMVAASMWLAEVAHSSWCQHINRDRLFFLIVVSGSLGSLVAEVFHLLLTAPTENDLSPTIGLLGILTAAIVGWIYYVSATNKRLLAEWKNGESERMRKMRYGG